MKPDKLEKKKIGWSLLRKILCGHYWYEDLVSDNPMVGQPVYGKGVLKQYSCVKCGKKITAFEEPINYIGA